MDPLFVDGVPAKLTIVDFRRYHLQSFPSLALPKYDGLIEDAIEAVYAIFTGVETLWDMQPKRVWYEKTLLCYRLLVAWYIADLYPMLTAKVPMMGGIPIKRKKIGGVDITFQDNDSSGGNKDYQDLLGSLKSNPFGSKAYLMIRAAGKRVLLGNRRIV